jgi:hypothetical protein
MDTAQLHKTAGSKTAGLLDVSLACIPTVAAHNDGIGGIAELLPMPSISK